MPRPKSEENEIAWDAPTKWQSLPNPNAMRKATYKVTVTGQGGFAGPVVMGCVGGPPSTTCAVSPASVSLSGPTADAKATVTVPAGAASGTYTITFSGTFGGVTRQAGAKLIVK